MADNSIPAPNALLSETRFLSNGLSCRLVTDMRRVRPRSELVIVIDEITKKQHVIDAWTEIEALREKVISIIGSDLSTKYASVLLDYQKLHEQGVGYGEIAKILNYRSLALVCLAYYSKESIDDIPSGGLGTFVIYSYFVAFRLGEDRLEMELEEAYEALGNGDCPWQITEGPFTRRIVRDNIDYLVDRNKKGQLVIKEEAKPIDSDLLTDASLLKDGWYEKTNKLLQNSSLNWQRDKKWIDKRLQSIKDDIRSSNSIGLEDFKAWLESGEKV
jgi:hypothetical protein